MPESAPQDFHGLRAAGHRLLHPFQHRDRQVAASPAHVVVRLSEEITAANAGRARKRLEDVLRSRPDVLEVGAVFFVALYAARAHGTQVIATHVRSQAHATLTQLGLDRVLDIYQGGGPDGSRRGDQ